MAAAWRRTGPQLSSRQKLGSAVLHVHWTPECLPEEERAKKREERKKIESGLYFELGKTWVLSKMAEYVVAPELAPALCVKHIAEVGGAAAKAWNEARTLDDQLAAPNC